MLLCVYVKSPFLIVLRVVSLNTPAKTAPVSSNPFEDDDEEEEEVEVKEQTTVNHIIVNKEDIKTLVNRSRHCSPTSFLPFFSFFLWFEGSLLSLLHLYYFAPFFEILPPASGGRVLC